MRKAFYRMLIAAAALAGFPLLAGFFSKDAILVEAFNEGHYALYAIGLFTALFFVLTAIATIGAMVSLIEVPVAWVVEKVWWRSSVWVPGEW